MNIHITLMRLFLFITLSSLSAIASPMTFKVTNLNASGPGSLSAAISASNGNDPGSGQHNTIIFTVAGTIFIAAPNPSLPTISQPVLIDGTTAPGWSANTNFAQQGPNTAKLTIELKGPGAFYDPTNTQPQYGLRFGMGSDGSIVRGLVLNNWAVAFVDEFGNVLRGTAIEIDSSNCTVEGCFIGSDPTGAISLPNMQAIVVMGSGVLIGGSAPAARNLLSGQFLGSGTVEIIGSNATIIGNTLGLNAAGDAALMAEARIGLYLFTTGATVGGLNFNDEGINQDGNVISGFSGANVLVRSTANSLIQGNYIGTNVTGSSAVGPNGMGFWVGQPSSIATASGISIDSNVISGHNGYGIQIGENSFNYLPMVAVQITNNLIGTDATGSFAIPNGLDGIWLKFAQATLIGGNTISGNLRHGIRLAKTQLTFVKSNWIGTNSNGDVLGNGGDGIQIGGQGIGVQAFGDYIGGAKNFTVPFPLSEGNIIAFNAGNGIKTVSFVQDETIIGNTIVSNGKNGILLGKNASRVYIGGFKNAGSLRIVGDLASQGNAALGPLGTSNLVAGNGEDGIKIVGAEDSVIQANIVELNAGNGISISTSTGTLVGAPEQGTSTVLPPFLDFPNVFANVVTENNGFGVVVDKSCRTDILSNAIFDNAQDGIELVTKN